MLPRAAAVVAALVLLAVPSQAAAAPAVSVRILSSSNLSRLPAKVTHRLVLTAGATRETVTVSAPTELKVGGDADLTGQPPAVVAEALAPCPGHWSAPHDSGAGDALATVTFGIPPGGTATVDGVMAFSSRPFADETLDLPFDVELGDGTRYTVVSPAPGYSGPIAPDMSLSVVRARGHAAVLVGQAAGITRPGLVEVWAYPPGRSRARHLVTVHTDDSGAWSWAGWRPTLGRWELFARFRHTPSAPVSGATGCGTFVPVRG